MSFDLPDIPAVPDVGNAVSDALPSVPTMPSISLPSVGLPDIGSEVSRLLDGLGDAADDGPPASDIDTSLFNFSLLVWGEDVVSWEDRTPPDGPPPADIQDTSFTLPSPEASDTARSVARTNGDLDHANLLALPMIRLRLFDSDSNPMPGAAYKLSIGDQYWEDQADGDGWAERYVNPVPPQCLMEWGTGDQDGTHLYSSAVYLAHQLRDEDVIARVQLQNLGYSLAAPLESNLYDFKNDYGLSDTDDARALLQSWHRDPGSVKPRNPSQPPPPSDPAS